MSDVRDLQQLVNDRLAELGDRRGPLSTRQAALRSDGKVSYETLRLLARGEHSGKISDETVAGLAFALDVPRSRVLAAMGRSITQPLPKFELPEKADQLTRAQRKVVLSVVDGLLSAYEQGREDEAEVQARDQGRPAARLRAVASGQRSAEAQQEARTKARRARGRSDADE